MDWEVIAYALAAIVAALVGIVWGRMAADLARVSERLSEVATLLHGHGIRLDVLEGREHGR